MHRITLLTIILAPFLSLQAQETIEKSLVVQDSTRNYLLYIPASYDGSKEFPLVVNLHGYALTAEFQMNFSGMNSIADTANFMVAYPQGLIMEATIPGFPVSGPGWNINADSLFVSPGAVDDVLFIDSIIKAIRNEYLITEDKIYACGFSNGGFMAQILGCEMSDQIAAVASVGGSLPVTWSCISSAPIPRFLINGTKDQQVDYENGFPALLYSVPESLDQFIHRNQCDSTPVIDTLPNPDLSDSSLVVRFTWPACAAELLHYQILDGGHQWPGGNNLIPALGHFNKDINASAEIWNFFKRNPKSFDNRDLEINMMVDDSLRSFVLHIPSTYDGTRPWPLIINYHGFANSAMDQISLSQMNDVVDTAEFLVAYPQGLAVINPFLGFAAPGWNVDGTLSSNDDVEFTRKLIQYVQTEFNLDPNRIHATGWSMGAAMAFQVSCHLYDLIASTACVSNQMSEKQIMDCLVNRPFSILQMHGTADPIVPFNGDGVIFSPAMNTANFWASNNRCTQDSMVTNLPDLEGEDSSTVTTIQFQDCDLGTEVLFYRIEGGGHSWPGGGQLPEFLGKINRDINASSEIINFFKRNQLQETTSTKSVESPLQFSVYPNPAHTYLYLEAADSDQTLQKIELYNQIGQKIREFQSPEISRSRFNLPLPNPIYPGTYFLVIYHGNNKSSIPVIIN